MDFNLEEIPAPDESEVQTGFKTVAVHQEDQHVPRIPPTVQWSSETPVEIH